jgi:iron(III) transport system ATP-binding protein
VDDALAMVGLGRLGDRLPGTLSGGQQQRVALARALAPRPTVLLLDEPFSNLDTALRAQVRGEVRRLLTDLGVTTVFVTHDQTEAFVLGDRVAVMTDGRVAQQGRPDDLYERPVSPWLAGFVGEANLLPGTASGTTALTACGTVALADSHDGPVTVLARPEEIVLAADGAVGEGATVELVEYHGHDTMYVVGVDGGPSVRARETSAPRWRAGDRVAVAHSGRPAVAWAIANAIA